MMPSSTYTWAMTDTDSLHHHDILTINRDNDVPGHGLKPNNEHTNTIFTTKAARLPPARYIGRPSFPIIYGLENTEGVLSRSAIKP